MSPPTRTSVMLVSGEYFDPFAPDPSVITLDVLAHGLQAPRFNNQTTRPISIAEHSLRVARIALNLSMFSSSVHPDDVELWALLHDAHKALVPWGDCLQPGKTDEMRVVELDVDVAIRAALGIALPSDATALAAFAWESLEAFEIVKTADAIALYFEAMLWQPGARDWAPEIMDLVWEDLRGPNEFRSSMVERFMPLIAPRPGECWRTEVEALLGARS